MKDLAAGFKRLRAEKWKRATYEEKGREKEREKERQRVPGSKRMGKVNIILPLKGQKRGRRKAVNKSDDKSKKQRMSGNFWGKELLSSTR